MSLVVARASEEERPILDRLLQLYLHELASHDHSPIGDDGLFEYRWRDLYWSSPHRHPYLLRFEEKLAGFALVRSREEGEVGEWQWQIAEFFILPAFRERKIGSMSAHTLLLTRAGMWEVPYDVSNVAARRFWASVAACRDSTAKAIPAGMGRECFLLRTTEGKAGKSPLRTEL
ncbi:MAG: GNAT family N-acetyltransferase [Akkermansiaceae bacterium]|nr:GNAT family N-acetyltransferase [Akkermansiaceae bacterium]